MSDQADPQCTCRPTGVVHPWGAELEEDENCYFHGKDGVNVVYIQSTTAMREARDVKIYDRFNPTPYQRAVEDSTRPYDLTKRELEVVMLLFEGLTFKQIGLRLGIVRSTIGTYMNGIYRKMGVNCASQVVVKWAYEQGLPAQPHAAAGLEGASYDD